KTLHRLVRLRLFSLPCKYRHSTANRSPRPFWRRNAISFSPMHREPLMPFFLMSRNCKMGGVVAIHLALSGCLSLAPDYEQPPLPVSDAFPALTSNTVDEGAANVAWRAFYRDPQLQTLIETALAHNRDLRIAAQRVE